MNEMIIFLRMIYQSMNEQNKLYACIASFFGTRYVIAVCGQYAAIYEAEYEDENQIFVDDAYIKLHGKVNFHFENPNFVWPKSLGKL